MKEKEEVDPTELTVFMARVAEQAQFYEDMLEYMKKTMDLKGSTMSKDERILV